jgi:hypothetical protein
MKELMEDPELKKAAKDVAKFARRVIDEVNQMPDDKKRRELQIGMMNENRALKQAEDFFQREFNAEVHIYSEDDVQRYEPKKKAGLARPHRPAIYIE